MFEIRLPGPGSITANSPIELAHEILTQRNINHPEKFLNASLTELTPPFSLKNIEACTKRLLQAIAQEEVIGVLTDHDCDGQTACAVLVWSLKNVFNISSERIQIFIGHKTQEGYGVSSKLCDRILEAQNRPSLIITADCGSSDEPNLSLLKSHGIDVIVTDHHTVPLEGPPASAFTIINPNQPGCEFPDKHIAGCFVAWFVMAALRHGYQKTYERTLPSLAGCLDFVAIGTMSDCMSLKNSYNNRSILKHGLKLIRNKTRPCWRALKNAFHDSISSDFLSFKLIPLINADGRLSDALNGVQFLLAPDLVTAHEQLAILIQRNEERRYLQQQQMKTVAKLLDDHEKASCALILNLGKQGHQGIHGVTASRLLSQHQKPCIMFSDHLLPELLIGSGRSPDGCSLKVVLDTLNKKHPGLLKKYGGHHQAAGLTIGKDDFDFFKKEILNEFSKIISSKNKFLDCDALLSPNLKIDIKFMKEFDSLLEPFGRDFVKPTFAIQAPLINGKIIGEDKNHLQLNLACWSQTIKSVFFFTENSQEILQRCATSPCYYIGQLLVEEFMKEERISFMIRLIYDPQGNVLFESHQSPTPGCIIYQKNDIAAVIS